MTLLTFSPLIGVLLLAFVPRDKEKALKVVGAVGTLLPLTLALFLFFNFQVGKEGAQFTHTLDWIALTFETPYGVVKLPIAYSMGVDGLSLPLIVLTTIIASLAAVASMYVKQKWKSYFITLLVLEVGMLGVFAARDLFLFFLFFEVTLVTTFLLVGGWGYVNRERAANQFLLYNGIGSGIMLLAFIAMWFIFGTMQYDAIAAEVPGVTKLLADAADSPLLHEDKWLMSAAFFGLLVAFGIKLPFFPFHTWMLRVHVEAPPAVVMLHSGVLLKMGAYGLLRFGVGMFPWYVKEFAYVIGVLGVINILYGAVLAFVQEDLKRVIAYSSISHMGIILLGIAALNTAGLQGAVFQAVSHGFISALLFFFIAALSERTGTTRISELGGLAKSTPVLAGIFLAAGMATLGLPGMSGFIGEFLAFLGIFKTEPLFGAVGVFGIVLAAVYTLRAVLRTTYGPEREQWQALPDTRAIEAVPMLVLLAFIILLGVYPAVVSEPLQMTLQTIVAGIGG